MTGWDTGINLEKGFSPVEVCAEQVQEDSLENPDPKINTYMNEFATPAPQKFEDLYTQADQLWADGIKTEGEEGIDAASPLYEEAMQSYLNAVWARSTKDPEIDSIFCLKLAGVQTKLAASPNLNPLEEGNRNDILFASAEKLYTKALKTLPESEDEESRASNESMKGLIFSLRADMQAARGWRVKASEDLEEALAHVQQAGDTDSNLLISEQIEKQNQALLEKRETSTQATGSFLLKLVRDGDLLPAGH